MRNEQLGATTADARRLARKAGNVFIHFRLTSDGCKTSCIMMKPATFLRTIKYHGDDEPMPSKLYKYNDDSEFSLTIGE